MSISTSAKLRLALASFIFGTLGGFSRFITMPSMVTTMCRGLVAAPFLLLILRIQGKKLDLAAIRKHFWLLVISGLLLATSMITLFEAYKYLSVAVSTMFYDLAPIIFVAVSPIFFQEKLTGQKLFCIGMALTGVFLVSNMIETGLPKTLEEAKGALFGLACATSYAAVIVINKKTTSLAAFDKTIMQLLVLGVVLFPVCLFTGAFSQIVLSPMSIAMTLVVCIFHTGIAYLCYFGALEHLPANTAAIIAYVEPVTAVLMSAFVLHEPMNALNVVGVFLVLGAAVFNELPLGHLLRRLRRPPQL